MQNLVVKLSTISGTGVFTTCNYKKGDVVISFCTDCKLISEVEYNNEQKKGNYTMIKTGCRFIDEIFLYTDDDQRIENFINHSYEPNLLYHTGICFANRDINSGEEITIDYTYLLAKDDYYSFIDVKTGRKVDGIDSVSCTRNINKQLLDLYNQNSSENVTI